MTRLVAVAVLAAALGAGLGESSARPASRTVSIAWVGDIAMVASADGGAGFFSASIRHELRSDVVIGNLEGTLTVGGSSKCGPSSTDCFAFHAPPSYAHLLKRAGFTLMNVANNHALDYGPEGQRETLAALRSAHLRYSGRPGQIAIVTARGVRVAVIGFAPYPWAQSLTDLRAASQVVRRATREADLVVVAMHAGAEGSDHQHVRRGTEWFLGENRGDAESFGHAVVDAGADLVLGSGPHVLRGMEWYHGRLIAYSLGNFLGNGTLSIGGVLGASGILHATLRASGAWLRGDLTPVRLVPPGLPALDPDETGHGIVRTLSREDFGQNGMRVTRTGQLLPPAWRSGYPAGTKPFLVLLAVAVVVAGGVAGATSSGTPVPTTFALTRLQAEEIAAVVGFVRAYNRGDLKAALGYFTTRPSDARLVAATDCDYRRRKTDVFPFRCGVEQWLRQRFADHDRLAIANIRDESRAQPIGFVAVEYARRTSDTLRSLGYRLGTAPQGAQKLGFVFVQGGPKLVVFGLASVVHDPPECVLVPVK